jgi:uncharacterized protein (TIGR00269 family)
MHEVRGQKQPEGKAVQEVRIQRVKTESEGVEGFVEAWSKELKPVVCDLCSKGEVILQRHSGRRLCGEHFIQQFERRFKRELRKQREWSGTKFGKVGIALSGGKDSTTLLHLLSALNLDLIAISVNEGIEGYRGKTLEKATKSCKELGVELDIISFFDIFGLSLDEMVQRTKLKACDVCGVLRRHSLSRSASSLELDCLFLAHNLDDVSQTILMNLATGNLSKVSRLPPHRRVEGMVPRLAPLQIFPEKEVYLYATLRGFDFQSGRCPYAEGDVRDLYRDIVYRLEEKNPSLGYGLLRSMWDIKRGFDKGWIPEKCKQCGMPKSSDKRCRRCEILRELGLGDGEHQN